LADSTPAAESIPAASAPAEDPDAYDDTELPPVFSKDGDVKSITFQTRILNQHLVCTLCMGYFNDACTIIECLHTFCRNCIMRHFRESSCCPQCETDLGTNPRDLVRTDRTLQSIVDKVFPQFARPMGSAAPASLPAEADATDSGSATAGAGGTATATADGAAAGDHATGAAGDDAQMADEADVGEDEEDIEPRRRKVARVSGASIATRGGDAAQAESSEGGEGDATTDSADAGGGAAAGGASTEEEISFSLQEETEGGDSASAAGGTKLEKPYLRTKAMLTIAHLRKYLGRKMDLPAETPIEFVCRGEVLDGALTLESIARTIWSDDETDLVLNYRVG